MCPALADGKIYLYKWSFRYVGTLNDPYLYISLDGKNCFGLCGVLANRELNDNLGWPFVQLLFKHYGLRQKCFDPLNSFSLLISGWSRTTTRPASTRTWGMPASSAPRSRPAAGASRSIGKQWNCVIFFGGNSNYGNPPSGQRNLAGGVQSGLMCSSSGCRTRRTSRLGSRWRAASASGMAFNVKSLLFKY